MVAGDHNGSDAGRSALNDGILYLRTYRVDHTGQAQEAQVTLQPGRVVLLGFIIITAERAGQHTQSLVGHRLISAQDLLPHFLRQRHFFSILQTGGAAIQDHVGRALGILHKGSSRAVHRGHHLAAGIKRRLSHTGKLRLQQRLGQFQLICPIDQRYLGGFTGSSLFGEFCITAQCHCCSCTLFVITVVIHYGHFILRQRAGFVGTDDLRTTQRFYRSKATDNGATLGHIGDTNGQNHGDNGRQTFGDRGNRQGNRNHKAINDGIKIQTAGTQNLHTENQNTNTQHQPGQQMGQLAQFPLQGGLPLFCLSQSIGDLAHFGIHTGGSYHGSTAAVYNGRTHIYHILAVAQRNVLCALTQKNLINIFQYRHRFTGKRSLFCLETGTFQQAGIGRHRIAGLQQYHITGHQIFAADDRHLAIPQNPGGCSSHFLKRFNCFFSLALLIDAQYAVYHHHGQNDDYICQAFALRHGQHTANQRSGQQDEDHRVGHLLEEPNQQGVLFPLSKLIFSVLRLAARCFRSAQTVGSAFHLLQYRSGSFTIMFHKSLLSQNRKVRVVRASEEFIITSSRQRCGKSLSNSLGRQQRFGKERSSVPNPCTGCKQHLHLRHRLAIANRWARSLSACPVSGIIPQTPPFVKFRHCQEQRFAICRHGPVLPCER